MRDLEREMGEWYRCDPGASALRTEEGEGAAPKCRVGIEPFRPSVRQWENKDKERAREGGRKKENLTLVGKRDAELLANSSSGGGSKTRIWQGAINQTFSLSLSL